MKRKTAWLGLSFILVAALLLAYCGKAKDAEQEGVPTLIIGKTFQSPEIAVTV